MVDCLYAECRPKALPAFERAGYFLVPSKPTAIKTSLPSARTPRHAEVGALTGSSNVKPVRNAGRKLGGLAANQIEADRFRYAVHGQVAGDAKTGLGRCDHRALEFDDGELLGVEEVWAAQMLVAFRIVRVDAAGFDHEREVVRKWTGLPGHREVAGNPLKRP